MRSLTREQMRQLLEAARARRERDWVMILVAYSHGLRASEVVGIRRDHIADGCLIVRRLKGSMKTTQALIGSEDPLFDERAALSDYLLKSNPAARLFPVSRSTFWRIVKRAARDAGLPASRCCPVALKHSIAMQAIQSAGVENVRQYLGHRSLSSTGYYLRVSDEDASAAIGRALGPGAGGRRV